MQASSCTSTNFEMESLPKIVKSSRSIGTSKPKSVESYATTWSSLKRKKIDWTTDWTVGEQSRLQSDNCVFTRAIPTRLVPELGGSDTLSPKRASNHRYGPGIHSLANRTIGRQHLVSRRPASAYRVAGSISSR